MAHEWRWSVGIGASDPSEIRRGLPRNFRYSPAGADQFGPPTARAPRESGGGIGARDPSETGGRFAASRPLRLAAHPCETNQPQGLFMCRLCVLFFSSEPLFTRECVTSADFVRAFAGLFELPAHGVEWSTLKDADSLDL
jgi:hypothetical protein